MPLHCSTSAFWPLQAWLTSVIGPVPALLAAPAEASGDAEAIVDVMPVTRNIVLGAAQLTRSFRSMNRPFPSTRTRPAVAAWPVSGSPYTAHS